MSCILSFCTKPNIFITCYVPLRLFSNKMNSYFMGSCMGGVPKTAPRFSDPSGGLTGLSAWSSSCLRFIPVKGYKAESAKGKGTWGKVLRNQVQASKSPRPVESPRAQFLRHQIVTTHDVLSRKLVGDTVHKVLFRAGQFQTPRKYSP